MATAAKKYKLSPQRLEELQQELELITTVKEREVSDLIKEARSFGDLSENSEYEAAKIQQGQLYARKAELEEILSNYEVIEEDENDDGDYIRMGSTVTVLDLEEREEETYKIVGSQEADPSQRTISEDSPLGRAILGKVEGEEVPVECPGGVITYRIVKVVR